MLHEDLNQKKRIVTRRIIREVNAYFSAHQQGMQMGILSAKYARALHLCGGFPECIDELVRQGELHIEILVGGARLVWPPKPNDAAKWF